MSIKREVVEAACDAVQEAFWRNTDEEVGCAQEMDITRAAIALLNAEIDKEKIERLLCKYWDLRPSEARYFMREGEEEGKIEWSRKITERVAEN